MSFVLPLEKIRADARHLAGGKGLAIARMAAAGFNLPQTLVVTRSAYDAFVERSGLRERVQLELNRKEFKEMRWEEIWDCAARVRNMFLRAPLPDSLGAELASALETAFGDQPVAVRSSALDEDAAAASFAGLHASYINVRGVEAILDRIRLVWASLWSDAALLYRQEIGLDPEKSAMAVLVQQTVAGDSSGIVFTRNPNEDSQAVIEAVHGLNQGLVDGDIEPDRWIVDRRRRRVVAHHVPERNRRMVSGPQGVQLAPLPGGLAQTAPLTEPQALEVFDLGLRSEGLFGCPQDVEWTLAHGRLVALQSRPITTGASGGQGDRRSWYLSLHRTFENLKRLRRKIEDELIPGMQAAAVELAAVDLRPLGDRELVGEIRRRWQINHEWANTYWAEFIPFAHGIRLFGQVYNDAVRPDDPYEFMDLLAHTAMASIERNRQLLEMAALVRSDAKLRSALEKGDAEALPASFRRRIDAFVDAYGDLTCAVTGGSGCAEESDALARLLMEMADHPLPSASAAGGHAGRAERLRAKFLQALDDKDRRDALELLDVARASYRLRDDDNIYIGRIEAQLLAAVQEAERRIGSIPADAESPLARAIEDLPLPSVSSDRPAQPERVDGRLRARQLTGQPAGPGLARGPACVIRQHRDLKEFKSGNVLVCDAVDPNMTFVVPLAAAVVERRGGMLIHGAIIAREYGLPCVTGIPEATAVIRSGDLITVDGYLGIVTIDTGGL